MFVITLSILCFTGNKNMLLSATDYLYCTHMIFLLLFPLFPLFTPFSSILAFKSNQQTLNHTPIFTLLFRVIFCLFIVVVLVPFYFFPFHFIFYGLQSQQKSAEAFLPVCVLKKQRVQCNNFISLMRMH